MAMKLERILLGGPSPSSSTSSVAMLAGPSRIKRIKVDITSDFNCPYCLLAVKQLQLATEKYNMIHSAEALELRYRFLPYQVGTELTEKPVPRRQAMRNKLGDKRAELLRDTVRDKLLSVGYQVHADETQAQISSTHLAHRLMTYALRTDPSIQLPLAMNLFEAHHLDGQYLSDKDFLTYQAMLFNLFPTGTRARQWLDSDECDAEVRRAYASTHRLGVTGVPFLVFQHRYAASGAMGVEEFVKLLADIVKREELSPYSSASPSPTSTFGGSAANGGIIAQDYARPRPIPNAAATATAAAHTTHSNYHHHQAQSLQTPRTTNGGAYQHRHHPYRSLSPGSDRRPRLPSPLGYSTTTPSTTATITNRPFKIPSPPHSQMYGEHSPGPGPGYGTYSASGRSPASTGYSAPSPGVSAERSTAGIDI